MHCYVIKRVDTFAKKRQPWWKKLSPKIALLSLLCDKLLVTYDTFHFYRYMLSVLFTHADSVAAAGTPCGVQHFDSCGYCRLKFAIHFATVCANCFALFFHIYFFHFNCSQFASEIQNLSFLFWFSRKNKKKSGIFYVSFWRIAIFSDCYFVFA